MKSIPLILIAVLLGACDRSAPVETEFNPTVDFTRYHSFSFAQPNVQAPGGSIGYDPRVLETIMETIRADLGARPMELRQTGADLSIAISITVGQGTGVVRGGYEWDSSGSRPTEGSYTFEEGNLVLDFFDTSSDQLVWRSWAQRATSRTGDPDLEMLEKLVGAMLKQYPPDPEED